MSGCLSYVSMCKTQIWCVLLVSLFSLSSLGAISWGLGRKKKSANSTSQAIDSTAQPGEEWSAAYVKCDVGSMQRLMDEHLRRYSDKKRTSQQRKQLGMMQQDLSFCASKNADERMAWQEGGRVWQQHIGGAFARAKKLEVEAPAPPLTPQVSRTLSLPTYEEVGSTTSYAATPTAPLRWKKRRAPQPPTYPSPQEFVDQ